LVHIDIPYNVKYKKHLTIQIIRVILLSNHLHTKTGLMTRKSTEIRQEQIKQAALEIIFTDGLKNLSTRNLAKHIGMSEGAIFRHFPSKQDIILSIIKDVQDEFIGSLRTIANSGSDPEKRLTEFLCKTVEYMMEKKGITMLLFSEASHNNDAVLKSNLEQIFNTQKKLASKIILDGIALGKWDESIDVENVTTLYMGIPVSLNIDLVLSGGKFNSDNFCSRMIRLLLKILEK
jgi:AcrR family transcriptional regulator